MRPTLLSLFFLQIVSCTASASVSIAVISDADSKDLSALITAELSKNPEINLIERDDLAKIGDEAKLQQLAGSDAVALGKLARADGLIFLDKRADGPHVRFTAVNLGYALFDDPVPGETPPPQEAQAIAHLVQVDSPKLMLTPSTSVPIALLNLRADYATPATLDLERKLTLLLESGLASVPRFVVLERRHAWSLGFERSLEAPNNPLLDGAWLLDGNLTLAATDSGDVTIHLRLRPPQGAAIESEVSGPVQDLPALAQKLIATVQGSTGGDRTVAEWHPEKEAREYLFEGVWGWQHKVNAAALEALDSAELLGEKAPQLYSVRSEVCGAIAGADLNIENEKIILPAGASAQPPAARADTIIRSIEDAVRFDQESKAPGFVADPDVVKAVPWPNPAPIIVPLASNILVLLDREDQAQSDRVRVALRLLTKFDPANGQVGPYRSLDHAATRDLFIEEWPATLAEQLATLRVIGSNSHDWIPSVLLEQGKDFCPRFLKSPEEQKQQFDLFVETLKDIPGAHLRYLIIKSSLADPVVADAAYKEYLGELWNQREVFLKSQGYPPDYACARSLPDDVKQRNAAAALPLLHYVLENAGVTGQYGVALTLLWQPAGWSHDEAAAVWKDYLPFKQMMHDKILESDFRGWEQLFGQKYPDLAVEAPLPAPAANALTVTKYWYPWRYGTTQPGYYYENMLATDDDSVWLSHMKPGGPNQLMRVYLPDFKTEEIALPEGKHPQKFVRTPSALYTTWETNGHDGSGGPIAHEIARYDPATAQWSTHPLPDFFGCDLYGAGEMLYLTASLKFATHDFALMRYDWDHDATTLLASTRRRPAQNQFDDNAQLYYAQMFLGPGGKPCVTTQEGTFFIQDTPGPWPPVFDSGADGRINTACGVTIVSNGREVVLLDPMAAGAQPLVTPVQPIFRKRPAAGAKPEKELPSWAAQAPWDAPDKLTLYYNALAFHEGTLFVLDHPKIKGGAYDLLCFRAGQGRAARHIPLVFHLDDQGRSDFANKPDGAPAAWASGQIEHPDTTVYPSNGIQFFATKNGLCFEPFNVGFWFLPYTDLDAYLKANPN